MTELPREQVDFQPEADGFVFLPSPLNAKLRFFFGYLKSLTPCNSAGNGIRWPNAHRIGLYVKVLPFLREVRPLQGLS